MFIVLNFPLQVLNSTDFDITIFEFTAVQILEKFYGVTLRISLELIKLFHTRLCFISWLTF